jgi:uncharacterized protein (DUF1800 family)
MPSMRAAPLVAVLLGSACAAATAKGSATAEPLAIPIPANGWEREKLAQHLLNRAAFGPSDWDRKRIAEISAGGWLYEQLQRGADLPLEGRIVEEYPTTQLSVTAALQQYPTVAERAKKLGVQDKEEIKQMFNSRPYELPRQLVIELTAAKLMRAVRSQRQLEEVLVDFWFNHFNVSAEKGKARWLLPSYERDAIRPYVFGKFRDLLGATARHPAMLVYLDNWMSVREGVRLPGLKQAMGLNENYARELLELHTVGVDAGYTQDDVREAARVLTGWSLELKQRDEDWGDFLYRRAAHDAGEKNVFGLHLEPGGQMDDGERLLDYLALHPATAHHLCLKLAQKFVSDDPPPGLVDALAAEYLRTGGDLRAVYVKLFGSREFWSDRAFAAKTKTPLELVASSVRALGELTSVQPQLVRALEGMGQPLYRASPPTGYAEDASHWVSAGALVSRINFGLKLARNDMPGVQVPLLTLPGGGAEAVVDSLSLRILGAPLSPESRRTVLAAVGGGREEDAMQDGENRPVDPRVVAGLLIGSPEFQKQ